MLPILKMLESEHTFSSKEIVEKIGVEFELTPEEKELRLKNGVRRYANIVAWAVIHLKSARLIDRPSRGIVVITDRGRDVLAQNPEKIDYRFLRQFPEYLKGSMGGNDDNSITNKDENTKEITIPPEEIIEKNYEIIRKQLADDLLSQILDKDPAFFERLVVKLLVRMGYGGSLEDAGKAVGRSGDGGIDGIIKEDRLGLDVIYLQAKRWKDGSSVGRPEIQKFVGALAGHGAKKGVFITTSNFSKDARDYRPHNDTKIVLIDGEELAQLMIDYNLGVTVETSYEIKRIDNDFFEEE